MGIRADYSVSGTRGAFLYVLGCREPLPGLHQTYTSIRWRQVLGSTMHCVAGDGVGILTGAVLGTLVQMPPIAEVALEYVLGFAFGWTVFQSLFMRGMAGGSYTRSLSATFIPELLSMNLLMASMVPVMTLTFRNLTGSHDHGNGRILVSDVDGFTGRVRDCVSHELGRLQLPEARHDDGAACRRRGGSDPNNAERGNRFESSFLVGSIVASEHRGDRMAHSVTGGAIALMTILSFVALGSGLGLSSMLGGL